MSLPNGWSTATIGELVRGLDYGLTASADRSAGGPRFLRITDIDQGSVDWSQVPGCNCGAETLERYRLLDGDIVFARTGSIEKAARIRNPPDAAFASYLIRGRLVSPGMSAWLGMFVASSDYVAQARALSAGIGRANINARNLATVRLVIPPVTEQPRIVEALDSYLSRLDAAVANLERAQAKLKAYRASVLKAAAEGRLVPTEARLARRENREYEPAQVLLDRILKERRRRWEEAELARLKKAGKTLKDDKWKAKYEEPVKPNSNGLPTLPDGWCWASVEQLTDGARRIAYGVLVPGPDVADGVRLVRISDLKNGSVDTTDMKSIRRAVADRFPRTYLRGGEVLISLVGTIGRTAVVPSSLVGANVARAIGVFPVAPLVSAAWCEAWLRSPAASGAISAKAHEVARKTLNVEDVRPAAVALPPAVEQERVVAELERLGSVALVLESNVRLAAVRLSALRQSILKWAFAGKLVDQDPNDEPAEQLLARIREAGQSRVPKRGRPKKRT